VVRRRSGGHSAPAQRYLVAITANLSTTRAMIGTVEIEGIDN